MLHIHYANRLEPLADHLIEQLAQPRDPLQSVPVGLPSRLLGRWLSLRMAQRFGVAANLDLRLHAELVWDCLRRLYPELEVENRFAPLNLRWRVFAALKELPEKRTLAPLRRYLNQLDERGKLQFSGQLAMLFDRYLVYRPQLILDWERGRIGHWQGHLWQQLGLPGEQHWAKLSVLAAKPPANRNGLPAALHLFALPAFSPSFLEVLNGLARSSEVHLYQWNPTPEYWAHVLSPRSREQQDLFLVDAENELLASWGQQLRESFMLAMDYVEGPQAHYCDEFSDSLLGTLQRGVFELRDLQTRTADDSLRIHICHSRRREVEVCYDHLLGSFDRDPELGCDDVLVLAPELDDYAPYIDAVFGSAPPERRVAFQLIGANAGQGSALFALRLILRALDEGLSSSELLELLRCAPLRRRFALTAADFDLLHSWFERAGLYRGPRQAAVGTKFSWDAALRRLMLSAVMAQPQLPRAGRWLPAVDLRLDQTGLLGRVLTILKTLLAASRQSERARTIPDWIGWLQRLVQQLFDDANDTVEQLAPLRSACADLLNQARLAEFGAPTGRDIFLPALQRALQGRTAASYFANSGGVRFCSASVGRLLPAKLIYVMGLADGEFPRLPDRSDLDLTLSSPPRIGDRSARNDDRQLCLEWLSTARDQLVLSYVGRSPRDDTALAPSPLIEELLAYVDRTCIGADTGQPLSAQLTTVYPLHPFAARRSDGSPNATYASQYARPAAPVGKDPGLPPEPRSLLPLPATVDLDSLRRFVVHPVRYFLRERLGIALSRLQQDDDEPPLALGNLDRYRLRQLLLRAPTDSTELAAFLEQRPEVAAGALGGAAVAQLLQQLPAQRELAPADDWVMVDLALDDARRLRGQIRQPLMPRQQLHHSGHLQAKHLLQAWLDHLVGSSLAGGLVTELSGVDRSVTFGPVAAPLPLLQSLADFFLDGQQRLLLVPPDAGQAYVEKGAGAVGRDAALRAFSNSYQRQSEAQDVWNALALRNTELLSATFEQCATAVWQPLLQHRVSDHG